MSGLVSRLERVRESGCRLASDSAPESGCRSALDSARGSGLESGSGSAKESDSALVVQAPAELVLAVPALAGPDSAWLLAW